MKELITRAQVDALIWAVAVLGVVVGPIAAAVARKHGLNPARYGVLFGGPLLLCGLLWPIYNVIEDHFGLDSVAALAINAGLFLAVGAACGVGWTIVSRATKNNGVTGD